MNFNKTESIASAATIPGQLENTRLPRLLAGLFFGGLILVALVLISRYSFLLFHSLAEIFSIIIAGCFFTLAWNTRHYMNNDFFVLMGVVSLFTSGIDILHMLAYKGMGLFPGHDANLPTQLWIASRYFQSIALLAAVLKMLWFSEQRRPVNAYFAFAACAVITAILFGAIFERVFPTCFVEGSGLTSFKKISELIISSILLISMLLLWRARSRFDRSVLGLLLASTGLMTLADLAFIFYVGVYDFSNLLGHIFKIVAFYLLYLATILTGLRRPYALMFRDLKQIEENLRALLAEKEDLLREIHQQVRQNRDTEAALRERTERYQLVVAGSRAAIWDWDVPNKRVFFSPQWKALRGYAEGEVSDREAEWRSGIHPDDASRVLAAVQAHFDGKTPVFDEEYRIHCKDGSWKWIADRGLAMRDATGRVLRMAGSETDITGRKRADEALRTSLAEKEVLLKEVHHRVKNNLAAIMGLLDLEGQALNDGLARTALAELSTRIRSMALVHEQLYRSENFSRINFKDYLEALIAHLRLSYERSGNIHVCVTAAGVVMGLDNAVPCGLLITELVTNVFKYAFPEGRPRGGAGSCEIIVSAEWDGTAYALTVADNGVGLPADLDWMNTKTLGLVLVRMLGQHQLQGRIELDRTSGTIFRLWFVPKGGGMMNAE
ncbi:MAG: MASE3 domain-containing protein [Pseudomonadota bacterium]